MKKRICITFMAIMMIFALTMTLAACGQTQAGGEGSGDAELAADEQQEDAGQANDSGENSDSDNPSESGGKANTGDLDEFVKILSDPKLPMNYAYELYDEIEPYFKINETYPRYAIKDNKIRIDNLAYDGEDKDKVIQTIYYDTSTKLQQSFDLKRKIGMEYTDESPESWQRMDLAYVSKQYTEGFSKNIDGGMPPLKKVGEETIDGNPCVVFEMSYTDEEAYVQRFYISKEYHVILRIYQEEEGVKKTETYRNFKAGQVTDDMVNPNIPADIQMTKQ